MLDVWFSQRGSATNRYGDDWKKRLQCNISSREAAAFTVTWDKTISKANKQEACCGNGSSDWARGPLPASVAPPATKEQTVIPTWLFCRGPHGAMIKTVQLTEGVRRPPHPLPLTAALPAAFPCRASENEDSCLNLVLIRAEELLKPLTSHPNDV